MKQNFRGFVHLFLIVVIVIIGIGGLLYLSWQRGFIKTNPQQETPLTPTIINEAANWKTYRNEENGFEFKYPSDWTKKQSFGKKGAEYLVVFGGDIKNNWTATPGDVIFQRYVNFEKLPFKEFLISYLSSSSPLPEDPEDRKQITKEQIGAMEETVSHGYSVLLSPDRTNIFIFIDPDVISLKIYKPNTNNHKLLFDQILSTFRFLDENEPNSTDEGQFCGGIAGIECPAGYICKLEGNFPDAGGSCVQEEVKK